MQDWRLENSLAKNKKDQELNPGTLKQLPKFTVNSIAKYGIIFPYPRSHEKAERGHVDYDRL